jgi:hypothetical protein
MPAERRADEIASMIGTSEQQRHASSSSLINSTYLLNLARRSSSREAADNKTNSLFKISSSLIEFLIRCALLIGGSHRDLIGSYVERKFNRNSGRSALGLLLSTCWGRSCDRFCRLAALQYPAVEAGRAA